MWFKIPKTPKKTFVSTSDNSIGFFKEDYVSHHVSGSNCWFITIQFKCRPYVVTVDYPTQEQRAIALKSLVEIVK